MNRFCLLSVQVVLASFATMAVVNGLCGGAVNPCHWIYDQFPNGTEFLPPSGPSQGDCVRLDWVMDYETGVPEDTDGCMCEWKFWGNFTPGSSGLYSATFVFNGVPSPLSLIVPNVVNGNMFCYGVAQFEIRVNCVSGGSQMIWRDSHECLTGC